MKKIFILLFIFGTNKMSGQQSFSTSFTGDVNKIIPANLKAALKTHESYMANMSKDQKRELMKRIRKDSNRAIMLNLPVFGIQGLGNINQEALKSFNASGKISFYARPVQFGRNALTISASYNINASNNDSVLFQKLIFPEIGNNSFTGSVQLDKFWKKDSLIVHSLSPFFEFSYKNISSDSSVENQNLYFTSLTYTIGLKYIFGYKKINSADSSKNTNLSFFAIPYLSFLNIPNEDVDDYRALLTRNVKLTSTPESLTDNITSAGFKIGFQVNGLQVFADFRNVLNKKEKVPIRELRGFNANIGIVFNADMLEFHK